MSLTQQSPIDLRDPVVTDFGKNHLQIKWKKSLIGTIKPDEHGVHVEFGGDQRQYVVLNHKRFHLVQFHFHHPSEHWIKGVQQTMELHVVHQNIDDGSRVVLGIFIDVGKKSAAVPDLIQQIKTFFANVDGNRTAAVSTNPRSFLPENTDLYYHYEGSLTTPEFDENVSWVVFKEPLLLPKDEVVELIKIFRHPARLPQPLCRRFVLANFQP